MAKPCEESVSSTPLTTGMEYDERALPEFKPLPWTLAEIRAAIPPHLFVRHTWRGSLYLARDIAFAAIAWRLAVLIDPFYAERHVIDCLGTFGAESARWATWLM